MQYPQMFAEMEFWEVFWRSVGVGNLPALSPSQYSMSPSCTEELHCLSWGMSTVLTWFSYLTKIVNIWL